MKVWIYCGVPGSGKTTMIATKHPGAPVCSSDHHFMNDDDEYIFDPAQIGEAHALCLRMFVGFATSGRSRRIADIVVDNTNTTIAEIAPYAALALAYGHELQIVTIACEPMLGYKRNTHGVTLETVELMHAALQARELPPWWPHEIVSV